ncbi:MAG: IPT/TIG domain-containing protein [Balneolaceae bacterium]
MRITTVASLMMLCMMAFNGCRDKGTSTSPDPQITSISPTSGPTGTTVTIKGSGFAETASANKVTFNGVLANVTSASESAIEAAVPDEAASGAVQVVVGGRTAVGPNFLPSKSRCRG